MIVFKTDLIWSQPNPYIGEDKEMLPQMPKTREIKTDTQFEKELFNTCKYAIDISRKVSEPIIMEVSFNNKFYTKIIIYPNQRPRDLHKIILLTKEVEDLKSQISKAK